MSIYDNETKIYRDLNPTAPQEPQTYRFNKLSEIETYFLNVIEVREQTGKKMKPNYINSDHWRNFYRRICQWCWIACWYCFVELAYFFLLQSPLCKSLLKHSPGSKKNMMLLSFLPKAS